MKKLISILLILLMLVLVFVSCNTDGKDDEANSGTSESKEEISSEQQNTSETTQEETSEEETSEEETTEEKTTEEITTVLEPTYPSENLCDCGEVKDEVVLSIIEKWNEAGLSYKVRDLFDVGGCWLIDSCYVFMPYGLVSQVEEVNIIGKYKLFTGYMITEKTYWIYQDGKFYSLAEACEKGILTDKNIYQMAKAIDAKIEIIE